MEKVIENQRMIKKQVKNDIINVINKMIANCEPFKYDDMNLKIMEKEKGSLVAIEKEDDRIGLRLVDYNDKSKGFCTSIVAMIATITDIAVGERLAFCMTDDDDKFIIGVKWYKQE